MSHSDDDVDQRFRDLIRAEFGDVAGSQGPGEQCIPPAAVPAQNRRRFGTRKLRDPIEYFNLSQAIEETTPDEDLERWTPPAGDSLPLPSLRVVAGIMLLVASLLMGLVVLAGLSPGWTLGIVILLATGLGLGLLLSALPRHRDDDDFGARI